MLWEWRGIANMDFIKLGGSSRVLSDFCREVWEQKQGAGWFWYWRESWGKGLYKLGCDRERLKMIKGMFGFAGCSTDMEWKSLKLRQKKRLHRKDEFTAKHGKRIDLRRRINRMLDLSRIFYKFRFSIKRINYSGIEWMPSQHHIIKFELP
ncbi:hypothetical protein Tco_1507165 [Tanacetum coccineum]